MADQQWTTVFRRSKIGPGVYRLHETQGLDADLLEATVRSAGACVVQRVSLYEPTVRAAALPHGAMVRIVETYGLPRLPKGIWIANSHALRHILRLLELDPPKGRLSGDTELAPTYGELEAEWINFAAAPTLEQVGMALPWLLLSGSDNFEAVRESSPVAFPITTTKEVLPDRDVLSDLILEYEMDGSGQEPSRLSAQAKPNRSRYRPTGS
jgi:hypothetical protein